MNNYKIVCISQVFNEIEKENLKRFIKHVLPLVDELVVYDDGSTDGSPNYIKKYTSHLIMGKKNEFEKEMFHKEILLKEALKLKPDFIFYLDADEVFSSGGRRKLEKVCDWMIDEDIDGASFHKLNLWRSNSWRRVDSLFDIGWFTHLWRVKPGMKYSNLKLGLHQAPYPSTVKKIKRNKDMVILHYGFSNFKNISHKYLTYKSHNQRGYDDLERLIDERKLKLKKVPKEIFPKGLWRDDKKPEKISYEDFMIKILSYRKNPKSPKYSIFSLIYKSTDWLKFSYSQLAKYTSLSDVEIFYIANDATKEVLRYLKNNKIPNYEYNSKSNQRKEWYINNVYRAYNFGARKSRGKFLVLINSDHAFTYGWLEDLVQKYDGENCICSRSVESGKLPVGNHVIKKNFGKTHKTYQEEAFNQFANKVKVDTLKTGGIYGPLFINRSHFLRVGGYPEGNVIPGSNIFNPKIAKKGEICISGDVVLMEKLKKIGIIHFTSFNSIVYHFQEGEKDSDMGLIDRLNIKNRIREIKNLDFIHLINI